MSAIPSQVGLKRPVLVVLLVAAILTFFFPLLTLKLSILGDQAISGYDILSRFSQVNDQVSTALKDVNSEANSPTRAIQPASSASKTGAADVPLSVRGFWLIPLLVLVGFVCAATALSSSIWGSRPATIRLICAIGAGAVAAAILHLSIANSDLHSWFESRLAAASSAGTQGRFAELGRAIGGLVARSFELRAGVGLYVLGATLVVAAIVAHSTESDLPEGSSRLEVDQNVPKRNLSLVGPILVALGLILMSWALWGLWEDRSSSVQRVRIHVSPNHLVVATGGNADIAATIEGCEEFPRAAESACAEKAALKWTIDEGLSGGHVYSSGVRGVQGRASWIARFSAPRVSGRYHVSVRSKADPQSMAKVDVDVVSSAKMERYYAVYRDPQVIYLRHLFDNFLTGHEVSGPESELLNKWDPSYYRSRFIVTVIRPSALGGSQINIMFQDRPDREFLAWVYTADGVPDLRQFEPVNLTTDQLAEIRRDFAQFLFDRRHSL